MLDAASAFLLPEEVAATSSPEGLDQITERGHQAGLRHEVPHGRLTMTRRIHWRPYKLLDRRVASCGALGWPHPLHRPHVTPSLIALCKGTDSRTLLLGQR